MKTQKHTALIDHEIKWFTKVLDTRMKLYFKNECKHESIADIPVPSYSHKNDPYVEFLKEFELSFEDRIALILCMAPKLKPQLLDVFYTKNKDYDKVFTEFGGVKGKSFNGFLPTGETLLFILAGSDLAQRLAVEHYFLHKSVLFKQKILRMDDTDAHEPIMSGALSVSPEHANYLLEGVYTKPNFTANFPAKLIHTNHTWNDLVLPDHVKDEIEDIRVWIEWNKENRKKNALSPHLKPGYKSLFYGPPGTGKTLTVSLLGKVAALDVYKIDLSMVVSKYIGETEKNLEKIFEMAENKNWILFFDEADSLFGKRTSTSSSNDKYANQEVAYLLQRIEDYPGLILLATNLKLNIDDAFTRRFQSMIHFPIPDKDQRLKLWKNTFKEVKEQSNEVDFNHIAEKYTVTGGAINNVLMTCILYNKKYNKTITNDVILNGIKRELKKEGKTL
jgi:hypothetical protein